MLSNNNAGAALPAGRNKARWAQKSMQWGAKSWFIVAAIGQGIFTLYIIGLYGVSALTGNFERWNSMMPHGYTAGDTAGNIAIGLHLLLAAVVSIGGPFQLAPQSRQRFPRLHRINGKVYIAAAFIMALSGLYLTWVRGSVGGLAGDLAITLNAVLLVAFAIPTYRLARARRMAQHQRWAWRLFMVMSGVWFFRIGLMLWLALWGRPVGFDPQTFTGPFLTALNYGQYLVPLALLEVYFYLKQRPASWRQAAYGGFLWVCTLLTAGGIVAATLAMWLPRVLG